VQAIAMEASLIDYIQISRMKEAGSSEYSNIFFRE